MNYVIFVQLKANFVGFPTVRRNSTNLAAMVGCYGDKVTMATVSGNLFLYSSKRITSKFRKFLSWYQTFSVELLKFQESLLPWQQGKYQLLFCFTA